MKKLFLYVYISLLISSMIGIAIAGGSYKVGIGEYVRLGEYGWNDARINFMYCGMINKDVFSIKSDNYRSSVNLYYNKRMKYIIYNGIKLRILEVTPLYIRLRKE